MVLSILDTAVGDFGQKKFYNSQEIGLAKELSVYFEQVIVYKMCKRSEDILTENIPGRENVIIKYILCKSIGTNGFPSIDDLNDSSEIIIYFSDTQLFLPNLYRWCQKAKKVLIPYIGVVDSHSNSRIKRFIINALFYRNIRVYRKCICIAKTTTVKATLEKRKIFNSTVIPVGLDTGILKTDYNSYDSKTLKLQYGYDENDRILLYIGRFCEEKQPIRMIEIFNNLSKKHNGYKLIMVGKGEQEQIVCSAIKNNKIENKVQIIDSIPNNQVWELYRISDAVINLNQQEIFGMVILEAMYYECKVVAWDAPGPDMIIENGISGWIVSDNESVIEKILDTSDVSKKAHERIVNKFTWEHSAYIIQKLIKEL